MTNVQTFARSMWCGSPRLEINIPHKTPHWLRYGNGHASLEAIRFGTGRVAIHASEYGDKSGKRTMLTLEEPAARALYDFLREQFDPPAKETP